MREASLIEHDNNFDYYLLGNELIEHFLIDVNV